MDNITIETLIQSGSYVAIFLLMIANGAVSFPSSQMLYIIAGYFVARGNLSIALVTLIGALGNTVGNIILYELARKHGRTFIERMKIFPTRELAKVEKAFQKKGAWFVFVGKLLPAIKVFVPIPAGLGKMSRALFATLMLAASYVWALAFVLIGVVFGKSSNFFGHYAMILIVIAIVVTLLFYRYINSDEILHEIES